MIARLARAGAKEWGGMIVPAGNMSSQRSSKKRLTPRLVAQSPVKSPHTKPTVSGLSSRGRLIRKRKQEKRAKKKRRLE